MTPKVYNPGLSLIPCLLDNNDSYSFTAFLPLCKTEPPSALTGSLL